eukprot:6189427-Pleurochrysis_carterae.AAC.5
MSAVADAYSGGADRMPGDGGVDGEPGQGRGPRLLRRRHLEQQGQQRTRISSALFESLPPCFVALVTDSAADGGSQLRWFLPVNSSSSPWTARPSDAAEAIPWGCLFTPRRLLGE